MVKRVNHIGIAVRSIAERRAFYEQVLGARFEGIEEVPDQKVRVAFFLVGEVRIELIEPAAPDSLLAAYLQKRGEGLHHIAFTVEDLPQRLAELRARGIKLIDEAPRTGAHGMRIAFIHPQVSGGVLTELCEPAQGVGMSS